MFFQQEELQVQVLDVLPFQERDTVCKTYPRAHCALSLRRRADTCIEYRGKTVQLNSHDLVFFPPEFGYIRRAKEDDMIVFHLNVLQGQIPSELEVLNSDRFEILWPLFEEALEEWEQGRPGFKHRVASILYRIFGEIQREDPYREKQNPTVMKAKAWLEQFYTDPETTVNQLAEQLHISETYLRRIFQEELSVSPKQYLNQLRMNRAKALLNAGYDSVAVIAEKVGFRDAKNFATAFKKQFGYPPSRQRYRL